MNHKIARISTCTLTTLALAALSACGGGGDSSPATPPAATTTSVSGVVVDGYLSGVNVCVDVNKNGKCDAGEPSATTASNGSYTIAGVSTADASGAPVVAQVPSTAIDGDSPSTTVGNNFVLMAPAGKTVVSPLTTLVQQAILKDSSKTADTAAADLKASAASLATTDVFADYVKGNDNYAHTAARVVANSLKANYDNVKASATGKDNTVAITLGEVARNALQSQGTAPNAALPVGAEDPATLLAQLASRTTTASTATQAVTINFDMVNGASSTLHCGDPITVDNAKRFNFSNTAVAPVALTTPTALSTPGQLVDTRFYVANVVLIDAAGNTTPLIMDDVAGYQSKAGGLALIDLGHNTAAPTAAVACTTTYHTAITGKVAPGTYTGIALTMGVPGRSADFTTKLNHTNATDTTIASPLQNADMAWSWQSGRKYMKVEFRPDTTPTTYTASTNAYTTYPLWYVHIGATGCSGDPTKGNETSCTNPNRLGLSFASFNASTQKIVFDVAALFKNAELDFSYYGPPGCMSGGTDPDCAPIFKALGIDLATGKTATGAAVQSVFSVK